MLLIRHGITRPNFVSQRLFTYAFAARILTLFFFVSFPEQVHALHDLWTVSGARHCRFNTLLDWLLQLNAQSTHLCLFQSRFPRGFPQHSALPVLQLVEGSSYATGYRYTALESALRSAGQECLLGELLKLEHALASPTIATCR